MKQIRVSLQVAGSLALLSVTVLMLAQFLGFVPDQRRQVMSSRISICENLAVGCSLLAGGGKVDALEICLRELKARNPAVISAGLRREDGRLAAFVGEHEQLWTGTPDGRSTDAAVYVPILQGGKKWGNLEVAFQPVFAPGVLGWVDWTWMLLVIFTGAANGLVFSLYLGKVFHELNPSRVMPRRVRNAFDTLTEGLLVLDDHGRIMLANQSIAAVLGRSPESLLGASASQLLWKTQQPGTVPPWDDVAKSQTPCRGVELSVPAADGPDQIFLVNAAPILDQQGTSRGVLASFHDITRLEEKKRDLLKMFEVLRQSSDKIRDQNEELSYLATRDSLTGCFNRRSFFEKFDGLWRSPQVRPGELTCLMADIDKFKSINDNFGHSTGDEVLRKVAAALVTASGDAGIVCRYGGEEFCVLLPNCPLEQGERIAEQLRQSVADLKFSNLSVTASFGASCNSLGAESCQQLLDQADKSLYCAKRTGRNRVIRWDAVPADFESRSEVRGTPSAADLATSTDQLVPYHAVASLLSAMAYRDPETATHSARVADLCMATARGLMTAGEAYVLEIAALLHDVGKIGVPDSILLKPGPLTAEEWEIMQLHARMGVEIVKASFQNQQLVEIVRCHHAVYSGVASDPALPQKDDIPLGARIVSIADAYDAMVSDRVYRKGRPPAAAFAELRRHAGRQFDPVLVERFIEVVSNRQPVLLATLGTVNKEVALHLGLQSERLVQALDSQDLKGIHALALRLETMARQHGILPLQSAAAALQLCVADSDLPQTVQLIHDIIELSLLAQQANLAINHDMAMSSLARTQFVAGQ
jgi:diguanylate cyclase (GGDEF)-like protein/PAS domain S-box-containing protein/putative nucleotidyltransferase with HDIG domain